MRPVSSQYLTAIQQHRTKGYRNRFRVEVFLGLVDETAKNDSTYTYSPELFYSDFDGMYDPDRTIEESYATWEKDTWRVDGTQRFQPSGRTGHAQQGYITFSTSDSSGQFATTQFLDFRFAIRHSIVGITVTFDELFPIPTRMLVLVYEGNTQIANFDFNDTDITDYIFSPELRLENFDRIVLQFPDGRPNQRIRINAIEFGIGYLFHSDQVFSFTHTRAGHPLSLSLPKNDLEFTLRNDDERFTADSESSVVQFLMIGQKCELRYAYDLSWDEFEWFHGGIFYLRSWNATGYMATFSGVSVFEHLTETTYEKSVFDNATHTMLEYANNVMSDTGLTRWRFDAAALTSTQTRLPLPIDTHAAELQLIANATRTILAQDDNEFVYFQPYGGLTNPTGVVLTHDDTIGNPEVTLLPACRDSIVQFTGVHVSAGAEIVEISKAAIEPGVRTQIKHDLVTDLNFVAIDPGVTIVSQEHYAYVSYVTTSGVTGEVALQGRENVYETYSFVMDRLIDNGQDSEIENPIINTQDNAIATKNLATEYYGGRIQYAFQNLGYPELDFGDVIVYNDRRVVVLENVITGNGGGLSGSLRLRGG